MEPEIKNEPLELDNKKKKKSKSKELFDALLFALVVAIILKFFFIEAYRIPTGSMENTLLIGDFLLVNKFIYGSTTPMYIPFSNKRLPYLRFPSLREPKQGDVVVFDFPGYRDEMGSPEVMNYIKRMIAGPGDTLQIINRVVYVNGKVFPNPPNSKFDPNPQNSNQTDPRIFPKGSGWNEDNYGPLWIPKEGDIIKIDENNFETWQTLIKREGHTIALMPDGRILIDGQRTAEYKIQQDYFFMMGDNRNNSLDSRYWGFVPRDHIVGEALMIYWSWDANIPFSEVSRLVSTIRWDRIGSIIR